MNSRYCLKDGLQCLITGIHFSTYVFFASKFPSLQNKLNFTAALSAFDCRKMISFQLYQSEEDILWSCFV